MAKYKRIIESPYVLLGILILVTGIVLYSDFIFGDKILAYGDWGYDTKHSYLPGYEAFVRGLANHNIEFYDFSYGLGTTWAARMMLICDPFAILFCTICALFSSVSMGFMLVYMQFFKIIVGGELCLVFLQQFNCSNKASILTAYVFSFCGYMIATGQHYTFSTFPVLAIFILVAVNRYIEKGKWFLLIFASAIIANMGPYITFQIYLMITVYVCIRVCYTEGQKATSKLSSILRTGLLIIVGLLISACPFLLQTYDILNVSSRISNMSWIEKIQNGFFWLPIEYVKTGCLRFFSNNMQGTVNTWNGAGVHFSASPYFFSTLFILCFGQFVYLLFTKNIEKKKKILFTSLLILFLFSATNAFIPMAFNVFAGLEFRYIFVWLPFFALLMAYMLDQIYREGFFSRFVNLIVTILCFLFVVYTVNDAESYVFQAKCIALLSLGLCSIILDLSKTKIVSKRLLDNGIVFIGLLTVIAIELFTDNKIVLYAERSLMTKQDYINTYRDPDMEELVLFVNELEEDNFIRIDRTYLGNGTPDVMLSALYPYRSVSIYNSTVNSNLDRYVQEFHPEIYYVNQISYNLRSYGMPFDTIIASNLGIKYLIADYERTIYGWDLIKTCNDRFLYQNNFIQSAGLIYQGAVHQSTFNEMSVLDKKMLVSQAIVLDDGAEIVGREMETYYKKNEGAITRIINQNGDILEMPSEGSVYLNELTQGNTIEIVFDTSKINSRNHRNFLHFTLGASEAGRISLTYNDGNADVLTDDKSSYLNILPDFQLQEIIIPLMPDLSSIKINCYDTDMSLKNMEVLTNPSIQYSNDSVVFENPNMGNTVCGRVNMKEKGYLAMPIVYEDGWSVVVDGEEKEILKANFGFVAIELGEGIHDVSFEYRSPILIPAICAACVGWCCVVFLSISCVLRKIKNK